MIYEFIRVPLIRTLVIKVFTIKTAAMPRIKSNLIYLIILYWGIAACTRNTEIVPEFEAGYIAGYVTCLDEFGNNLNPGNVEIFLYGTPEFYRVTDSEGFYKIAVPIGYQHIIFQKEGLGSYHLSEQLIIGGPVPVVFNDALLCKPVDVEVIIDSSGLTNYGTATYMYIAGKATSATPFDLVMKCYPEESPEEIKYFWIGTFDESESSVYTCNYIESIYLENFSASTQYIYAAICCQNAYDYVHDEGGTLKQVTEYVKIDISDDQ
jgi:hypothetical protein